MRLSASLLLLPVLVAAQEQVPLADRVQGWLNKAKSLLPSTPPAAPAAATTAVQQASKAAAPPSTKDVTTVTGENWRSLLAPVDPKTPKNERDWLIFITGGNKTCFSHCERAEKAFNVRIFLGSSYYKCNRDAVYLTTTQDSVPLFAADPTSPKLGVLDCDKERLLCSIWSTGPPSLWYFVIPEKAPEGQPQARTALHPVRLNITMVTTDDIYKYHSEKRWETREEYQGALHPIDGWMAEYGFNVALGYVAYALAGVPSWVIMIVISLISRTLMYVGSILAAAPNTDGL
jgi:hypothetical protein